MLLCLSLIIFNILGWEEPAADNLPLVKPGQYVTLKCKVAFHEIFQFSFLFIYSTVYQLHLPPDYQIKIFKNTVHDFPEMFSIRRDIRAAQYKPDTVESEFKNNLTISAVSRVPGSHASEFLKIEYLGEIETVFENICQWVQWGWSMKK